MFLNASPNPDIITRINNGTGGSYSITYKPATRIAETIIETCGRYPVKPHTSPRLLVTKLTTSDGLGNNYNSSYTYYNGKYHSGFGIDRANLGFEWVKTTDDHTGTYVKKYYSQIKPYAQMLIKTETYDIHNALYKRIEKKYAHRIDDPGYPDVKFVYLTEVNTYNFERDSTAIRKMKRITDYDLYGNPGKIIDYGEVDYSTGTDVKYDATATVKQYAKSMNNYISKPYIITNAGYNLAGQWVHSSKTRYYFDDMGLGNIIFYQGRVTKKEVKKDDNTYLVASTMGYDDYGNVIWTKDARVNAGEYSGNTTEKTYDPHYRTYITSVKNALGQTSFLFYDALMQPIKVRDINGAETVMEYNIFGNVIKKILPGDSSGSPTTRTIYNHWDTTPPKCIITKSKDIDGNTINLYTYLDGLGRKIQTKKQGHNQNEWIVNDTYYDSAGRVNRLSVPYLVETAPDPRTTTRDASKQYVLSEFDSMGRVIKVTKLDTTCTKTGYGKNWVAKINENGHVIGTATFGNKTFISEYTGTVPNHSLYCQTVTQIAVDDIKIIDGMQNTTLISINMLGQKTAMTDPDMGTWTYSYDANGNLKSQTDARGQTIRYEYDKLNRRTKIDYPTGTDTLFYYDEAQHGYSLGKITREVYEAGSMSYTYDNRGRVITKTRTIDNIARTMNYTFDQAGRVSTITYPDGEGVTFSYDSCGSLAGVTGASPYITSIKYNVYGAKESIRYGNGITQYYDYYDTASEYDNSAGIYFSNALKRIYTSDLAVFIWVKDMEDDNIIVHSTIEEGYDFHIKNKFKRDFHFKISSFLVPAGLLSEAIQITKDGSPGYTFTILSTFNTDPEKAETRLKERIKKGINTRYIKGKKGSWEINAKQQLRGRIEWTSNNSDTEYEYILVIDGKRVTFEEFIRMLKPYEGWQFKMEIIDPCDNIYD